MSRILVCGGRDYADWPRFSEIMYELREAHGRFEVISGMAPGADTLAASYAHTFGLVLRAFPTGWTKHGRAAGPIRNQQMLDEGKPDLVVAFPGDRRTADMVRRARAAGVEVREIK